MAYSLPSHGTHYRIREILGKTLDSFHNKTVRVIGRVVKYDPTTNLAYLVESRESLNSKFHLIVDTRLTDSSEYIAGAQIMLIGELMENHLDANGDVMLQPRIVRNVDTLDYPLYSKTLDSWRAFMSLHFGESS